MWPSSPCAHRVHVTAVGTCAVGGAGHETERSLSRAVSANGSNVAVFFLAKPFSMHQLLLP